MRSMDWALDHWAGEIGLSPSSVHDVVRRMAASGMLTAVPDPRGTVLELAAKFN
jgi:Mn-dependent DtxR family transcriptional regulator